ncbi:MAG: hypothetical protein COA57_09460 [Flavobacteriales bacterium]|nr:MAG: hypothetical protein COA57_09460 [Flavobacteriales bacterium]
MKTGVLGLFYIQNDSINTEKHMKIVTFICILFIQTCLFAQNEGNIWYFGEYAGIDFNGGTPVALTNGSLNTFEGCASICDNTGTLLFYTHGEIIWNKNHAMMPNGTGLNGNISSSQSAIIVKKPGSNTIYCVFTVDIVTGSGGLRYSEVDMNLQSGLGDVNSNKNIPIVTSTCEKVTAIKHQNNTDYWIITHLYGSNAFHSYLLTSTGLNMTPVISNIGTIVSGSASYTRGYLKGSADGNRIALANRSMDNVELFDFDNTTGLLSNVITFNNFSSPLGTYGIEFSPNSNLLYVSESQYPLSNIYQYNLLAGSATAIINSRTTIGSHSGSGGAIQLAPDNKIYHARFYEDSLGVINDPNSLGISCNYIANGFFLAGKTSRLGLPSFYSSIASNQNSFTYANLCKGDSSIFAFSYSQPVDSVLWNFDDPNSGVNNTSSDTIPVHLFTDTGTFIVSLVIYFGGNSNTYTNTIFINPTPTVNLGNDTTLCQGETLALNTTTSNATYLWQDNSINQTFNVTQQGTYWVVVNVNGCSAADTINVNYNSAPTVDLGNDTTLCQGETLTLDVTGSNATHLWQNNSTDSTFTVTQQGTYWVQVTDSSCGSSTDTVNVMYNSLPTVDLGNDTTLCQGETLTLDVMTSNATYQWQDNSTDSTFTVAQQGTYWVQITDSSCGSSTDTVNITYNSLPTVDLGNDKTLCQGETLTLDATTSNATYLWQDNSTDLTFNVTQEGTYWVQTSNKCGMDIDSIFIYSEDCNCYTYIPNTFTPDDDGRNDNFYLKSDCEFIRYDFLIFNRWGKLIFESKDPTKEWDGKYKGATVPIGVYIYNIKYTSAKNIHNQLTGHVTLIK